jgi:periodic tryptophan protein 1
MEANLDMADEDDDFSDEDDHVPIFTSELAKLKEKELGKIAKNTDPEAGEDEDLGMEIDDNDGFADEFSESSEDKDDYTIRKGDNLIVTATADDDHSNLEVYIYDHKNGDLYVHHELILGSYPLCLEWLKVWDKK